MSRSQPARTHWVPVVWACLLALLLLGPVPLPGLVLSYDMVWVPDLTLRPDFWGLGSGLPRAVPSDAVVAVLDQVLPGALLQKVVLVGSLVGAGLGADRLVRERSDAGLAARLAAVSVYQWSPFVAERLLIGHWPMLLCLAVLPWVLVAGGQWREAGRFPVRLLVLVPLGSLSASAGLATAVALLVAVAGREVGRQLVAGAIVLAANAPWLVAGVLHADSSLSDPRGASVFALSGEGSVPAPLAALTLGGIWNSEVVPPSRAGPLGWLSLALLALVLALGLRHWWRTAPRRDAVTLVVCWALGYGVAVLTWAAPDVVAWAGAHVPGAAVLRDGSRLLVLCAPLLATVTAAATDRVRDLFEDGAVRVMVAGALVLLPVLFLVDAAWGLRGQLRPVDLPADYAEARRVITAAPAGDVLVLPLSSYRAPSWNHGRKVLDPAGRSQTRDFVASDVLIVSGTSLSGEDPRVTAAADALEAADPASRADALARLGFGVLLVDREAPGDVPDVAGEPLMEGSLLRVVGLDDAHPRDVPRSWVVAMSAAWSAFAAPIAAAVLIGLRRVARHRRS